MSYQPLDSAGTTIRTDHMACVIWVGESETDPHVPAPVISEHAYVIWTSTCDKLGASDEAAEVILHWKHRDIEVHQSTTLAMGMLRRRTGSDREWTFTHIYKMDKFDDYPTELPHDGQICTLVVES